MENAVNKLIQTAKKWNGYLEKKSNKDLDSFDGHTLAAIITPALPGTIISIPGIISRRSLGVRCMCQMCL